MFILADVLRKVLLETFRSKLQPLLQKQKRKTANNKRETKLQSLQGPKENFHTNITR